MNILHITTDLGNGGAQSVLYSLVTHSKAHKHIIITMVGGGKYHDYLNESGYTVISLEMSRGSFSLKAFFRLWQLIRQEKPDVIQTWMYHANVFGGVAARLGMRGNIVWGIHNTKLEDSTTSASTKFVIQMSGWLSRFIPSVSICCSRSAIDYHTELNYPKKKMVFVANGYDVERFAHKVTIEPSAADSHSRHSAKSRRTEYVTLARWDAQKDYPNLIMACSLLIKWGVHDFHCTLAGSNINEHNVELMNLLAEHEVSNYFTLLGAISNVPELLQKSDYLILPSLGEAFPNVVAEAMLSGTPCIVTDVGDAAEMVQSTGWVVEPRNSEALAKKMLEAKNLKTQGRLSQLEAQCRARAVEQFPVQKMVEGYENVWRKLMDSA